MQETLEKASKRLRLLRIEILKLDFLWIYHSKKISINFFTKVLITPLRYWKYQLKTVTGSVFETSLYDLPVPKWIQPIKGGTAFLHNSRRFAYLCVHPIFVVSISPTTKMRHINYMGNGCFKHSFFFFSIFHARSLYCFLFFMLAFCRLPRMPFLIFFLSLIKICPEI